MNAGPGLAVGQSHPIAHAITSHDDHVSLGPPGKDGRETSHEDLETSVGLKIAGDVGDDLILAGTFAIAAGETEFGGGVGAPSAR